MEARLTEILQEKFQTGLEQATNEQVYYALLTLTKERIKEGPKNEGKRKLYYISAEIPDRKAFIQQPDQPWNL